LNATLSLLAQLTEREIKSRHAGSALGLFWALASPLLLLAIYSIVFGQILVQRIGGLGTESYTLFVAIGLWPWMMFADGVSRGLASIQSNANLVKKVAFPHIFLVLASVASSFLTHLVGYAAVLAALAAFGMPVNIAGIPTAMLYLALLFGITLGAAAFLAAMQTLLRDVEMAVMPAVTMLHFLTPVIYPLSVIPEAYRRYLEWNPLTGIVDGLRHALLSTGGDAGASMAWFAVFAAVTALTLGGLTFHRLSPYFEDFL
jgi:lipopolysaccharide transport system permease protein